MRIVLPAEAPAITVAIAHGLRVSREAFLDRAYDDNGRLVPRSEPGSVLTDAREVAQRAVQLVTEGRLLSRGGRDLPLVSDTLCLHGDGPGAVALLRAVRRGFAEEGILVRRPVASA
jgi:5-oxoprolinase (ATP-hydrolysing) subunit A